ncbi:MAG: COQ9 family protein, partial [Pseudomonadota bacterium]
DDLYDGTLSIQFRFGRGGAPCAIRRMGYLEAAAYNIGMPVCLHQDCAMTDAPSKTLRDAWLDALLPNIAFDGWTDRAAGRAADLAGLSRDEQALAAPNGVSDLIEHYFDRAEARALETLNAQDLTVLRVHEKVASGVRAWLDAMADDKETVRRAIAYNALPWRASSPIQRTWQVADMVWTAAGDTAQDYNKYSKRGLLAAVLPAITLYWLDHDDPADVDAYIARRLKNASRLGQAGGRIAKPVLDAIWARRG